MATLRIAFVGDSFVNGTGDPDALGWVGRAAASAWRRGHDVTVYNLGIRRDTSTDIAARWRTETARRLPPPPTAALVFSFGANDSVIEDGTSRVPLQTTLDNARTILAAAHAIAPTLMLGPLPIDDAAVNANIAELDTALAPLCDQLTIPYLQVFAPMHASGIWRTEARAGDGAHPAAAGYTALANLVDQWPAWRSWLP